MEGLSNANPFRFREKTQIERADPNAKKIKSYFDTKKYQKQFGKRICSVCGKKYEFGLRWGREKGKPWCIHDAIISRDPTKLTSGEQKRIGSKLKANEIAVKGNDGIIRICERPAGS